MPSAREFNFDGLVGPTHNYAGLSFGNVASSGNAAQVANPKEAAMQGLAKMQELARRGFAQAVLPPQPRPDFRLLRRVGFTGSDAAVLAAAQKQAPALLASAYSASAMWTANAATVSPSADTADGRVHFTVANLNNKLHRAIEPPQTARILRAIFADERHFVVHDALPGAPALGDEGAANHTRLAANYGEPGVELFVYGRSEFQREQDAPKRYPARQTLEASQAVARLHELQETRTLFARQTPAAVDAGVFHNDVIAVGNGPLLFYHAQAFADETALIDQLRRALASVQCELQTLRVAESDVPLRDAVSSYLFNSQLLSREDGRMLLLVPRECEQHQAVARYLLHLLERDDSPIDEVLSLDLRQSMRNGGGPACLRLRVVLTEAEAAAMHSGVLFTQTLHARLVEWVERHYRDRLVPEDLADPALARESAEALQALEQILGLRYRYPD